MLYIHNTSKLLLFICIYIHFRHHVASCVIVSSSLSSAALVHCCVGECCVILFVSVLMIVIMFQIIKAKLKFLVRYNLMIID